MKREDWIGLGVSVVLHAGLLLGMSFVMAAKAPDQIPGYVEVDFGTFSDGRPVSRAEQVTEDVPRPEPEAPRPEPTPAAPPEEARPVSLPEAEVAQDETVEDTPQDVISPLSRPSSDEEEESEDPEETAPLRPLGSGNPEGATDAATGEEGTGTDDVRRAPFSIEGLNRQAVRTTVPRYTEQVNAVIRVRIEVGPDGRVVRRIPLIKGNPGLEQAVMEALLEWRFNPLPVGAPQVNQSGVVTFRFRLQ